jgi:hypothetical protein
LFKAADLPVSRFQLNAGELRSASSLDTPTLSQAFRAADLQGRLTQQTTPFAQYDWPLPTTAPQQNKSFAWSFVQFAAEVTPTIRSAAQFDLPPPPTPFTPTDLRNSLLPPFETFTGFPFRQQEWLLPVLPPVVDRSFSTSPFANAPPPPTLVDTHDGFNKKHKHLDTLKKRKERRLEALEQALFPEVSRETAEPIKAETAEIAAVVAIAPKALELPKLDTSIEDDDEEVIAALLMILNRSL